MIDKPLVSIIISSYNYARFLPQAVESALGQTYSRTEVIIVDDGSTDGSSEVMRQYSGQALLIDKPNGGQASAFNTGFGRSRGEVVIFLDSDDSLYPTVVQEAMDLFAADRSIVKVHWPLAVAGADGNRTGRVVPAGPLAAGDLCDVVLRSGPGEYVWPPTSGNAWSRRLLESILPMPEEEFRTCPDLYLSALAPLFGPLARLQEPRGIWRVHGDNNSWKKPFDQTLRETIERCEHCFDAVARHCRSNGIEVNLQQWRSNSWWYRISDAIRDLCSVVTVGETFVLVDEEEWAAGRNIAGRKRLHFTERDGQYWGPPPDDETAIRELERLRDAGAKHVVFAWPAFWWLTYYAGFLQHLRGHYRLVLENQRLVVFDLFTPLAKDVR